MKSAFVFFKGLILQDIWACNHISLENSCGLTKAEHDPKQFAEAGAFVEMGQNCRWSL